MLSNVSAASAFSVIATCKMWPPCGTPFTTGSGLGAAGAGATAAAGTAIGSSGVPHAAASTRASKLLRVADRVTGEDVIRRQRAEAKAPSTGTVDQRTIAAIDLASPPT